MIDHDQIRNLIQEAATGVFSTMLGSELRFVEAHVNKGPSHPLDGVICLIGMAGEWTGTGTLACPVESACRMASQMLMAEYSEVDADVLDAVAEVANMVIGNVKTALEELVGPMGMSVPTAIFGKNFLAKSFGDETWVVVIYEYEGQQLEIKLFLRPIGKAGGHPLNRSCEPLYLRT